MVNKRPKNFGARARVPNRLIGTIIAVMTCLLVILALEFGFRLIDGYPVFAITLGAGQGQSRSNIRNEAVARVVKQKLKQVRIHDGVDPGWFRSSPDRPAWKESSPQLEALSREATLKLKRIYDSTRAWNRKFIDWICENPQRATSYAGSWTHELFQFDALGNNDRPRYRFLPDTRHPTGLNTNNFGWKSPDISLNKPKKTIRIAFVGASTTIHCDKCFPTYPDYVGHWLNLWARARGLDVRFEIINAARSGNSSQDIAAIVTTELLPVEPDLVVYYEGANQFSFAEMINLSEGKKLSRKEFVKKWKGSSEAELDTLRRRAMLYSALVRRIIAFFAVFDPAYLAEPVKPAHTLEFPAGVNEMDPEVSDPKLRRSLPLQLPQILNDLDQIRTGLADIGGELVLSTFVWFIEDGWRLDATISRVLYNYINTLFMYATYADVRRMADFQNRVFRKYAREKNIPLLDIDARLPRDPMITGDGVHMPPEGMRLRAWVTFNELLPVIEARLAKGVLPKPDRVRDLRHPGITAPRLIKWYPCETR